MPYFTIFDRDKLDGLIDYLNTEFMYWMRLKKFLFIYLNRIEHRQQRHTPISALHATASTGKVLLFKLTFHPRPPPSRFSLSPSRAFEVISNGYPGTAMPPFQSLTEGVRWGLVRIVYQKGESTKQKPEVNDIVLKQRYKRLP